MKPVKLPRLLPLTAAFLALPVFADDLFFAELPIVASVSRLPQRIADAPASVTVIDREMIRASGVRSLNDIFRLVPGFQTFAHSDTSARVNYHGITDDNDFSPRVQVLIDGRSLHSPLFRNGVNWSLIPIALEDIERIEVVRGTNAVSYGTNAFLGVINIVSVDPSLIRGSSVSVNRGSQGVRDHTLRTGGRFGENGNFRLTYQEVKDDGLEDDYDWQDSYRNRRLDVRIDQNFGPRDLLEVSFGIVQGKFTRGRFDDTQFPLLVSSVSNPIRDLDESSAWLQTRWLRTLAEGADVSLRYTFNHDKGDSSFVLPTRPPGYQKIDESGDRGQRHEIEALHNFSPWKNTRLVWGGSWRRDTMESKTMLRERGEVGREVWRVFANGEWRPNTWLTANLGTAAEQDSLAGTNISPRASLAFHVTDQDTLRLGYARAWRASSLVAYRANFETTPGRLSFVGNPHLPPEQLDSWELGYLADWRAWKMSLDVRHFREKLTDRVMSVRTAAGAPNSEQSIQDMLIRGYEAQWKWQPFDGTRLLVNHASMRVTSDINENGALIRANVGSSFNANYNGMDGMSNRDGVIEPTYAIYQRLADESAPRRSSSILISQRLPGGFDVSVARYWVDAIKWTRNTGAGKYQRTDARIGYRFNWGGHKGEFAYVQQSVDGAHVEQRDRDEEPKQRTVDRRHWVSLRLDF